MGKWEEMKQAIQKGMEEMEAERTDEECGRDGGCKEKLHPTWGCPAHDAW